MTRSASLTVALMLCSSAALWAQVPSACSVNPPGNDADRLSRLEAETQSLRTEVQWLREHPARLPAVEATPASMMMQPPSPQSLEPPEAGQANPAELAKIREEMKKIGWKKGDFTVTPYGYLWGNTVYSTERTSPGSYTLYVLSASARPETTSSSSTSGTRGWASTWSGRKSPSSTAPRAAARWKSTSKTAVLTTENKPTVLLRHAYFDVKDDDFRFLVGQTWDVISPLYPGMLMYSVGWDAGDIGYRRAQFRDERYFALLRRLAGDRADLSINQDVFSDDTTTDRRHEASRPIGRSSRVAWPGPSGIAAKVACRSPSAYRATSAKMSST